MIIIFLIIVAVLFIPGMFSLILALFGLVLRVGFLIAIMCLIIMIGNMVV
jgi:hypothetical protein